MARITILSPIHNEEGILRELLERTEKVMRKCCRDNWEYLLIDDASTDSGLGIIKETGKKNKSIRVIHHKIKRGQAGCFMTGFNNARGEIVITMDGDLEVLPEDIPLFIAKMNKGYDVVNGIREHRTHSFWIKVASRIYNTLMLLFFNSPVMDSASNFTAVKTRFVRGVKLRGNDHRYIVPIAMVNGAKIVGEVIVRHNQRSRGKSKYKALPKYIFGGPEIMFAWIRFKLGYFRQKKTEGIEAERI